MPSTATTTALDPATALVLAYSTTQQAPSPATIMQAVSRAKYAAQARCVAHTRVVHVAVV